MFRMMSTVQASPLFIFRKIKPGLYKVGVHWNTEKDKEVRAQVNRYMKGKVRDGHLIYN
jgi:hypothetical protein